MQVGRVADTRDQTPLLGMMHVQADIRQPTCFDQVLWKTLHSKTASKRRAHSNACILDQNISFKVLLAARYPLPSIRASYIAAKRCAVLVMTNSSCSCSSGMSSVLATANENRSCRCASVGSSTLCPVKYSVSRSWAVSEAPSNPALFKICRTACTLLAVVKVIGSSGWHACLCAGNCEGACKPTCCLYYLCASSGSFKD